MKVSKSILITQPVRKLALEIQEEEFYDITGLGITKEEFADAAANIVYRLAYLDYDTDLLRFHDRRTVSVIALGLNWKAVTAAGGSWVSVSNDEGTGIASSLTSIFSSPYNIQKDEVKTLLDMMNEAWYTMINK